MAADCSPAYGGRQPRPRTGRSSGAQPTEVEMRWSGHAASAVHRAPGSKLQLAVPRRIPRASSGRSWSPLRRLRGACRCHGPQPKLCSADGLGRMGAGGRSRHRRRIPTRCRRVSGRGRSPWPTGCVTRSDRRSSRGGVTPSPSARSTIPSPPNRGALGVVDASEPCQPLLAVGRHSAPPRPRHRRPRHLAPSGASLTRSGRTTLESEISAAPTPDDALTSRSSGRHP